MEWSEFNPAQRWIAGPEMDYVTGTRRWVPRGVRAE
jgi:hypothetical protein